MNLSSIPSLGQTLWRGFCRICPACGLGSMFQGYLTPLKSCQNCALEFALYRSDDAPAYFTVALVGHLILPAILWSELHYSLAAWIHFILWVPLTILLTLILLPFIKGMVMAVIWRTKEIDS